MTAKKPSLYKVSQKDLEFIMGTAYHRMMLEVGKVVRSRRTASFDLKRLAPYFVRMATHRQVGRNATKVSFPKPWSFEDIVAWLVYYTERSRKLLEDEDLSPLLMEVSLAPYPLDPDRGIYVETKPDLIARHQASGCLGVYDYKTVSPKQYQRYVDVKEGRAAASQLNLDLLLCYGAAAENDSHEVGEQVTTVGFIAVPRVPLSVDRLDVILVAMPFERSSIKSWRRRRLDSILKSNR